jgi:hypothetical protein
MEIEWARIKEALHYMSPDSGASIERARGAVIGVSSTLVAVGYKFEEMWPKMIGCMPDDLRVQAIPPAFLNLTSGYWTIPIQRLVGFQTLLKEIPEEMRKKVDEDSYSFRGMTCRDIMLDRYLYVMSVLQRETDRAHVMWNSDLNGDPKFKPDLSYSFNAFRKAGSQFIAEWAVSDNRKPVENSYNFHGQNTSQWLYAGCLLVQNGRVSIHT